METQCSHTGGMCFLFEPPASSYRLPFLWILRRRGGMDDEETKGHKDLNPMWFHIAGFAAVLKHASREGLAGGYVFYSSLPCPLE